MTDYQRQDLSEVESLLASRQQLSGWLDKLEAAGSKTPPSVRDRVRSDYQARLAQVVDNLRSHSDVIGSTLQGLRGQAEEYEQLRTEEQETLAEAELRHSVGEYTDEEWNRVEKDCSGKISGLDEELDRLAGEIGRLEEVLSQIMPPAPAPSRKREPEPKPEPAPRPEPPVALVRDEPPPVHHEPPAPAPAPEPLEAPRFVPRGGLKPRESGPARTIPFPATAAKEPAPPAPAPVDELTFLKSMTLDPRNAGGQATSASAATEVKPTERPAPTVAKTLKCGECGALNRPTEWYCERCGAELAAV
ncbi:MAG: hypothetical protein JNJ80_09290 [Gemmatimonadetes bacterium]|nr:hypothetical protein [Gemmatimonadota bacterium]MCC7132123.1 hypothetical protein [Gemmatimonadales bacterium]